MFTKDQLVAVTVKAMVTSLYKIMYEAKEVSENNLKILQEKGIDVTEEIKATEDLLARIEGFLQFYGDL